MAVVNSGSRRIECLIVEALAQVRQVTPNSLHKVMVRTGNDLAVTSKEQSAVIAILEDTLGTGPLVSAKDFGRNKQANLCLAPIDATTLKGLSSLVCRKLAGTALIYEEMGDGEINNRDQHTQGMGLCHGIPVGN